MSLLRDCTTGKILRDCATGKILRACPVAPPADICTELGSNPGLTLDFVWSGVLACCSGCYDVFLSIGQTTGQVIQCPSGLPSINNVPHGIPTAITLPSALEFRFYYDNPDPSCSGLYATTNTTSALLLWQKLTANTIQVTVYVPETYSGTPLVLFDSTLPCPVLEGDAFGDASLSCPIGVFVGDGLTPVTFTGYRAGAGGTYTASVSP